jgi:anti-anti-sigma factor
MAVAAFTISVRETVTGCTVICDGDLDMVGAGQFQEAVDDALLRDPHRVYIDCTNVAFIDSTGIRALIHTASLCESRGIALTIGASPAVRHLLDTIGVASLFTLAS